MKIRSTVALTTLAAGLLALSGCAAGPVEYFGYTHSRYGTITVDGDKTTFTEFACKGQKPDETQTSTGVLSSDKKTIVWDPDGYMEGMTADVRIKDDRLSWGLSNNWIHFYKPDSPKGKELQKDAQESC